MKNDKEALIFTDLKEFELARYLTASRVKAPAVALLKLSDSSRFSSLLDFVKNQFSLRTNQYLANIPSTLTILYCYVKPPPLQKRRRTDDDNNNITFLRAGALDPSPGTYGITHEGFTYYGCDIKGHYCDKCPQAYPTFIV